ncbi:oxygenase MpaB family protein [uncultured Sphingomonas sp.]|uniref:oxygenase MpaB family protein n=1 Tax=uncultured Sphingomonas sp. TaxID=158754 RepID=UPI0025ED8456|nr:oxygenase MpaB family protein [uncultured Sphingomonas sp.]
MLDVRDRLQARIHRLVGFGSGEIDLDHGDAGLFGPESAAWTVHGDFTAMMIGGVAALLMQMLHPAALAGVLGHSNFRQDMPGRLRRTAQFVAGTTYGSTEQAEALIARVRAIHARVRGTLPDGTRYAADDPALLTWVHVAEMSSFLAAHIRYCDPAFPLAEQDRYLAEVAAIAERLGATGVPRDRAGLDAYMLAVRPQLRASARMHEVARALLSQPSPSPALAPFGRMMLEAGVDLLPDWARALHDLRTPPRPVIRAGVRGVGQVMRWALRDGSASRARRRVGVAA